MTRTPGNVTEQGLKEYVERYLATLQESAQQFLQRADAENLRTLSLLPAKITCYVSTNIGVAIEFEKAKTTTIETKRGSARIEDLVINAPRPLRKIHAGFRIQGENNRFIAFTVKGAFPFELATPRASIVLEDIDVEIAGWRRTFEYAEFYADRTAERWSSESAITRGKNEILVALLDIARANEKSRSLSQYIKEHKAKTVLVLGDYSTEGLARLELITEQLKVCGYEPVLGRDIPDVPHEDLSHKVIAIGAAARFVVIDDSSKSGHLTELEICRHNRFLTVILRSGAGDSSYMTAGASIDSNVILEKEYDSDTLGQVVVQSTQWVEQRIDARITEYKKVYPWR